jgi:CheY-like chemotaxis protein
LTRQLVKLMGGDLAFESRIGVGTKAIVTLQRAAEIASSVPTVTPEFSSYVDKSLAGVVLYIEDNEINVLIVEQMLAEWPQVQFMHAPDGEIGIAMAKALQPNLILLDMNLPDMSGLDILRRLREDPAALHLKVVVLSASAMASEIERAIAAGAQDYWTKPLDFERFLEGVGKLLAKSSRYSTSSPQ